MSNTEKSSAKQRKYDLGLMSGTSANGIDLASVTFDKNNKLEHHVAIIKPILIKPLLKLLLCIALKITIRIIMK